jgi:hypothetical protein
LIRLIYIHFEWYFRASNKNIISYWVLEENKMVKLNNQFDLMIDMVTRIVKIGGASITDKSQFESVKLSNIDFIVDLFKNNFKNLILIHGAGSFG